MKTQLIYTLALVCLIIVGAEAKDGNQYSYGPDGKNFFTEATDRILIQFGSDVTFTEKAAILSQFKGVKPLSKDDVLPAPDVTIANVSGLSTAQLERLLGQLNDNPSVQYANPFMIYEDGTYQGIQDRVIVRLKSTKDLSAMYSLAKRVNMNVLDKNEFDPMIYVLQTTKQSTGNALEMANLLHESGAFEYAEPDFLLLLRRFNTNDTNLDLQWSLDNTGSSSQYNGTAGADMNVFQAWATTTGSSSIKVAILDEGVDLNHPDLAGNMLGGYDATGQGSGGDPQGDDAHGTACAGIVAAVGNNNRGVAGVAYNAKIIPVRIAYSSGSSWVTSNTWIGNALNWAWDNANADILSNSWGGGSSSSTINNAISGAVNNGRGGLGAPVLFAAGNDNGANSYPATQTNVISVIAMSMCYERKNPSSCDGETWWGSNYGSGADVAAPGVKIATTDISGADGYGSGDYTGSFNGTSSATPNAAGVMALILSASPGLSESQARFALESTCRKVGSYVYNSGVSGQPASTWSNDLGYGLIDAEAAVLSVSPQVEDDAGISSISSPDGTICATSTAPSLTLNNFGSNTLNSVIINYQLDAGAVNTYNWTGSLGSTSSTTVNLASISFSGGSHTFNAWTSNPNGTTDNVQSNDASNSSFSSASNGVTLTIVLDNYPEETSWQVMDGSTVLASGGTYGSEPDGSTVVENICLPDGCFDFVINDAYGDGICCSYGSGSYILTADIDGATLASGGSFASSETTNFCVTSSSPLIASISESTNVSCYGGNNGSATASASGGNSPYAYSWSNGATGATASGLTTGIYTVTVTDGNSDQAQENITISEPNLLLASASGIDAHCNGGATGSANASVSGGVPPYSYAWSSGGTSASENELSAGSYSVTITDDNGCADVAFVTINNLPDTDNDGVCDTEDQCPGQDDALIGTACNDGNVCTTGDVYDTN
ncbi:S8 family serine peptidase [Flavobacteriales bacterium]|nr:S8 family serine peptidase [Flavobacteriales bacterium]